MKLQFTNEGLRRKIPSDPDDEPTAGGTMSRESMLEDALRDLMAAYERRVRSACADEHDLARQPWRCLEYVAAEQLLEKEHSHQA